METPYIIAKQTVYYTLNENCLEQFKSGECQPLHTLRLTTTQATILKSLQKEIFEEGHFGKTEDSELRLLMWDNICHLIWIESNKETF